MGILALFHFHAVLPGHKKFLPVRRISSITGTSNIPRSVRVYSVRGGISAKILRLTNPAASKSCNFEERTRGLIFKECCRIPKRRGPLARSRMINATHFWPMISATASTGHLSPATVFVISRLSIVFIVTLYRLLEGNK
jgi:hypothetical protein